MNEAQPMARACCDFLDLAGQLVSFIMVSIMEGRRVTKFFRAMPFLAVLSLLMLSGCAYRYAIADGKPLMKKQGLIAIQTSANADAVLLFSRYDGGGSAESEPTKEALQKRTIIVTKGQRYWVLPVVSGEYVWNKFSTGKMYSWLHNTKRFVVRENEITYLGHVEIDNYVSNFRIDTVDNEEDINAYLSAHYPIYSKKYPLHKEIIKFKN